MVHDQHSGGPRCDPHPSFLLPWQFSHALSRQRSRQVRNTTQKPGRWPAELLNSRSLTAPQVWPVPGASGGALSARLTDSQARVKPKQK